MNKRNTAHAIMFHHFHDENKHISGQGSINDNQMDDLIAYYDHHYHLLSADEWYERATKGKLGKKDVCLTFDDGLKCQFDIALPILESRNLTAFWFVYSSHFLGKLEKLELYRYFRFKCFEEIDEFYQAFFRYVQLFPWAKEVDHGLRNRRYESYLSEFSFYSIEDRKFRFVRDQILGKDKYDQIMMDMIEKYKLDTRELRKLLWMNEEDLAYLDRHDHVIGLHSHTHPTLMKSLPRQNQQEEYMLNYEFLSKTLKKKITSMSHPCNSYNRNTLDILAQLSIKVGFRANMEITNGSSLEFPRIDHTYILKEAQNEYNRFHQ